MVTKGYAASEVHEAFLRALELCEERGETHRRAPVLLGLWRFYNTRAEFQKAYDLGEELLILAMNIQNPAFHLEAYYAMGITSFHLGDFASSRGHFEQGINYYRSKHGHTASLSSDYGEAPEVVCLSRLALGCLKMPFRGHF